MRFLRRFVQINFEIALIIIAIYFYYFLNSSLLTLGDSSALLFLPLVDKCPRLFQGKALQSKVDRIHHNQCLQSRGYG